MQNKIISITKRTRSTPFTRRVEAAGVKAYTVYNHMLLPTLFDSPESDYWHLCEHVQVWDVSCERQVEVIGPDADKLVQLMTPRDLSKTDLLQGKYAPICDAKGHILNDPIIIKRDHNRWWISLADSDIKFWAQGLAQGYGLDVDVFEPDVSPLGVQGPKSDDLMSRVFGDEVRDIGFFRGKLFPFMGTELYVARSGWSKQGGFEIYLHDWNLGEALWDELFEKGQGLEVRAGCPNGNERIEAGLLSYGSDMDESHTPFDCGLDSFLNLDADVDSLSLPALRRMAGKQKVKFVGITFSDSLDLTELMNLRGGYDVFDGENFIGEIKSQCWSYRYEKHLALAMLNIDYLEKNNTVDFAGQMGNIHDVPFSNIALAS